MGTQIVAWILKVGQESNPVGKKTVLIVETIFQTPRYSATVHSTA